MYATQIYATQMAHAAQTAPKILSPERARKAGNYNTKRARRIGWPDHWSGVCRVLSINNGLISAEDFAQHVAKYQIDQRLKPDGMLGTDTWRRMKSSARTILRVLPPPLWLPKSTPRRSPVRAVSVEELNLDAPWMAIAEQERKTNWINDAGGAISQSESQVDEGYFEACPYLGKEEWEYESRHERYKENRAWCAAFVNYCLHTVGYSHTGSAGALSFKSRRLWRFKALDEPKRGCVIVLKSNKSSWKHVAFLDKVGDLPSNPKGDINSKRYSGFTLFGGNQGGKSVNSITFSNSTFFAAMDKFGNKSPYLYPIKGENEANCNVELDTGGPHYCGRQWL